MPNDEYDKLRRRWLGCKALSEDKSTTPYERESARQMAKKIYAQLRAMGMNAPPRMSNVDDANYKDYVARGLQAKQNIHLSQGALGALASSIVIEYDKEKLQQYALDVDVPYSTLRNYRATYKAWRN